MTNEEKLLLQCPSTYEPDPNDWTHEEFRGAGEITKKEFPVNFKMRNQKGYPACGCYGITHAHNAEQLLENDDAKQPDPVIERKQYCDERETDYTSRGSTMGNWLRRFKDNGRITGYVKCETIEQIKQNIDAGNYIYTGSPYGNRGQIKKSGIREERDDKKFVGHLYAVGEYNDEGFLAINSRGEERGVKDGRFLIKWEDVRKHFGMYAILDKVDSDRIEAFKIYKTNKALRHKYYKFEKIRDYLRKANDILREIYGFDYNLA